MVSPQMKFVVVAHHQRTQQASELANQLGADCTLFIDHLDAGANAGHRRALEWASEQDCRVVVLEDDAILMPGFKEEVTRWLGRFPDSLVSFYLGTGRPPQFQQQIAERLIEADRTRSDYITLPQLIHGVCYSVPQQAIGRVLSRWDNGNAADYAIGEAHGGTVVYPCYSLVDHTDGITVERHPDSAPRTERRKAWRLAPCPH